MLPISVDQSNRAATDTFIRNAGLGLTADDVSGEAWMQHGTGYVPTFVIINGVSGATGMQPWQVLYRQSGYAGAAALRQVIDSVTLPATHSADTNRDLQIDLFALTRVIELDNTRSNSVRTGRYRVQAGSEDGFAPGA